MKSGCSIFVGNIDFEVPEERIIEELGAVGKVVSFRMVYDKTTGKSRGFGFCEYESPLIVEKALQNLKISFNGRPVKINYAENDMPAKAKEPDNQVPEIDNLISVLDNMDKDNLKEVLFYLRKLALDQPSYLRELLNKNSSLVYAIIHAILKLKLVDPGAIDEVLKESFDLSKQKMQILERICSISEDDLCFFPEDVRNKIKKARAMVLKSRADK
ncbi:cleavage stimulation factor [Encephalitozoon intestinalis ATCC 50506]|uniref:Cleavage stimulation factor n=1 Tax=Encephalitozoon intestinalis (strain ATCC 50506) TaxID=876142 RepID=E0S8H2_ENCIT|nr:cleavage stimulation factor [Encephalitozoon intestinalis ATCC 50506]ADM11966.1 cleavage stimulation factor [Encephalitozoon intestinalis ATCC 50506]UTX45751.1 heterogeneous nuclear ribonucleoprotein A1 [Encephalitozoon intestinalis]